MNNPETTTKSRRLRLARIITEATAPAVSLTILLPLIGWHAAQGTAEGLLWGLAATLFAAAVPMAYILRGVRRGRITDHHVGTRQQRRKPLLVGLASVTACLVLMALLGAPREMIALLTAGITGLIISVIISHWWKMSLHTAVAAGSITIIALVFGPAYLLLALLLIPISWARVALADHTLAQVAGGSTIGALIAAAVFTLAR